MVFVNEAWNSTGDIVIYSNYHKYWLDRERKIKNPLFDVCKGITICVVPSSDSSKQATGIGMLAEMLAQNGRVDRAYFLRRNTDIDKLASGGRRDMQIHLQSISTVQEIDITGEIVLLMDDVTTTGNYLYACREILIKFGAEHVAMFALGKAI